MKITFAHMHTMSIVMETLLQSFGQEPIVPPPISKRTLELGVQYSPETVCLPFKLTLGNFIEGLEQGAEAIITCGGVGPCRLGYYAEVQRGILKAMGYSFKMIIVEPTLQDVYKTMKTLVLGTSWFAIWKGFTLAFSKLKALDNLERQTNYVRPRVIDPMQVDTIRKQAIQAIHTAQDITAVETVMSCVKKQWKECARKTGFQPLRVGLIGEIYVTLEPFINQDLEMKLGHMGIEVVKPVYLSDYVRGHLLKQKKYLNLHERLRQLAQPYLGHYVGGHALHNVGFAVSAQNQLDGLIHVYPFSCMPEVVAKNILPQISQEKEVPILSLAFDEQTGQAGVVTRLEAFVDLLRFRQSFITKWQGFYTTR